MMHRKRTVIALSLLCAVLLMSLAAGGWVFYDNTVDRSGWAEADGIRIYRDFHGDPTSGWLILPEGRCYFQEGGIPLTGFQTVDGIPYYFEDSGVMHTGWLTLEGKTYYFGGNGTMVTGWLRLGEDRYYLPQGYALTGWQDLPEGRCYFDETGLMALGLTEIAGSRYYFDDGFLVTGDVAIGNGQYYFCEDGALVTGWLDIDGQRRYYREDGTMVTGWAELDGRHYLFEETGYARVGWVTIGEYSYYFLPVGSAAVGPVEIDGKVEYFTPSGIHIVLVNATHPIPQDYQANPVSLEGNFRISTNCYDALTAMLADCAGAGNAYTINSAYRTVTDQETILENRTRSHMKVFKLTYEEAKKMALTTVAVPGTSEHQLGLAVDVAGEDATAWLTEHCWDYGFIVRYEASKQAITGIADEPWHFRYVGREVALDIRSSGLCLEEYLGAA